MRPFSIPGAVHSVGRYGSLQNLVLERDALGVVLLEPGFRGILIDEHLDVLDIANLLVLT
jgi:hypothetical protein